MEWINTFGEFGIRVYDPSCEEHLQSYCQQCFDAGMSNNSSPDKLKIDFMSGDNGQYLATYHRHTDTIVNMCGMHHQPLITDEWSEDMCWRIGVRNGTLPAWRKELLTNLSGLDNLTLKYLYPIQMREAISRGARKIVVTTNTPTGGIDRSGKMFKVDRVLSMLAKRGYFRLVGEDIMLYDTPQNVWEFDMGFWSSQL